MECKYMKNVFTEAQFSTHGHEKSINTLLDKCQQAQKKSDVRSNKCCLSVVVVELVVVVVQVVVVSSTYY